MSGKDIEDRSSVESNFTKANNKIEEKKQKPQKRNKILSLLFASKKIVTDSDPILSEVIPTGITLRNIVAYVSVLSQPYTKIVIEKRGVTTTEQISFPIQEGLNKAEITIDVEVETLLNVYLESPEGDFRADDVRLSAVITN